MCRRPRLCSSSSAGLVGEVRPSCHELNLPLNHLPPVHSNLGNLRIAEDQRQARPAAKAVRLLCAAVIAGDEAFIKCFMEDRPAAGGIASDVDGQVCDLRGPRVVRR